jgi:cytidine deaminase
MKNKKASSTHIKAHHFKTLSQLDGQGKKLYAAAKQVRKNAYAPYSHFKVGAALRDDKGRVFIGCNVENASYGGTQCAERSAITAMVAAGGKNIREIVVVTDTPEGCPPCGFCRQVLSEFCDNPTTTKVHIANLSGGLKTLTVAELLPHAFNADYFG